MTYICLIIPLIPHITATTQHLSNTIPPTQDIFSFTGFCRYGESSSEGALSGSGARAVHAMLIASEECLRGHVCGVDKFDKRLCSVQLGVHRAFTEVVLELDMSKNCKSFIIKLPMSALLVHHKSIHYSRP